MRLFDYSKTSTDTTRTHVNATCEEKEAKRSIIPPKSKKGGFRGFVRSEYAEQVQLADWIDHTSPDLVWTASCGGMRTSVGTATKMKRMGYKKGYPDIMIFEKSGQYAGLFIELKRERGGIVSPEQKEKIAKLNKNGYFATVCKGIDEAKRAIQCYFLEKQNGKI